MDGLGVARAEFLGGEIGLGDDAAAFGFLELAFVAVPKSLELGSMDFEIPTEGFGLGDHFGDDGGVVFLEHVKEELLAFGREVVDRAAGRAFALEFSEVACAGLFDFVGGLRVGGVGSKNTEDGARAELLARLFAHLAARGRSLVSVSG